MMIIGCDFHPSWQQVSWLDTETGDCGERKLVHVSGEAKMFYQQLAAPVLIGMEATGNSQWFVELVEDLGHAIWIGDAAQIRASYVRKQKTDKRDAAHILKLLLENRFPRLWMPDREPRGTEDVARACVETVGLMPAGRLAGTVGHVEPTDRQTRRSGATCGRRKSAGQAVDDAAGSGSEHGAGVCAHHWGREPFSPGQAGGQLSGTDSARGKFGWAPEAGRDHQAGQSHAALAAG